MGRSSARTCGCRRCGGLSHTPTRHTGTAAARAKAPSLLFCRRGAWNGWAHHLPSTTSRPPPERCRERERVSEWRPSLLPANSSEVRSHGQLTASPSWCPASSFLFPLCIAHDLAPTPFFACVQAMWPCMHAIGRGPWPQRKGWRLWRRNSSTAIYSLDRRRRAIILSSLHSAHAATPRKPSFVHAMINEEQCTFNSLRYLTL